MPEHDVREALRNVPIRIWSCVREGHRHVEWRGDVAHCIEPGCGITSTDAAPWLQMMNEEIRSAGAKALRDFADRHLVSELGASPNDLVRNDVYLQAHADATKIERGEL